MNQCSQGDIITIEGRRGYFLVVSMDSFIKASGAFHVCPIVDGCSPGPIHIPISMGSINKGNDNKSYCVLCEQMRLINPSTYKCTVIDRAPRSVIEEVSDVLQGLFECK